jgi:hypothetical protein
MKKTAAEEAAPSWQTSYSSLLTAPAKPGGKVTTRWFHNSPCTVQEKQKLV